MANITEKEAELVRADKFVKQVIKNPQHKPIKKGRGKKESFLTSHDKARKEKGRCMYFTYIGETITIL